MSMLTAVTEEAGRNSTKCPFTMLKFTYSNMACEHKFPLTPRPESIKAPGDTVPGKLTGLTKGGVKVM